MSVRISRPRLATSRLDITNRLGELFTSLVVKLFDHDALAAVDQRRLNTWLNLLLLAVYKYNIESTTTMSRVLDIFPIMSEENRHVRGCPFPWHVGERRRLPGN